MSPAAESGDQRINARQIVAGGNVILVNKVVYEQAKSVARKSWRALPDFSYPGITPEDDLQRRYFGHLLYALHATFPNSRAAFTTAVWFAEHGFEFEGAKARAVHMVCNQPSVVGVMESNLRRLWGEEPITEKKELQDNINAALLRIGQTYRITSSLRITGERPTACRVIYDPFQKVFSLEQGRLSFNPADFESRLHVTSEIIEFFCATYQSPFGIVDEIQEFQEYYPLLKVLLVLLDHKPLRFSALRINTDDSEEWDFLDPAADRELRYGAP